jgi:hypothetical protein
MILLLLLFLMSLLIFIIVVLVKRLNKPKVKLKTETINIFGKDYVIDLSPEAQQKRNEEYEVIKQNSWKEIKEVDLLGDNGEVFYKTQWVNGYEQELTGFYGIMTFSPDKKYCVVFVDASNDSEKGKVALVETESKKLLYSIEVNRPHKCNVSNNGLVACNDWNSRKSKSTTFYVFDLQGNNHFSQRVNENIGDICLISIDGNYAAFDTCASYSLKIVDVNNKKIISSISKDYTTGINIDFNIRTITLQYADDKESVQKTF